MAFRGHDESEDSNNQGNFLELLHCFFSILVDESRDTSMKEQMSVVIRYVKNACILEHFIGVIHVLNTTAASLKAAIDQLFSTYSLIISNLRGQGYDGTSNMRGEYNGLKALILKENPSAYYIHCFAHQLQLALVAVAQKHPKIETFLTRVHRLVNIVGGSAKRSDLIRENQRLKILESHSVLVKYQADEVSIKKLLFSVLGIHVGTLTIVV
ncbi:zinc finger MYM-type protein 1-like [Olea europaea var. sylvestris]|uniref:zinc finger MYM-type protein 1-like n=1 Tax=Olea europaea var. sylvestris TaxID=158386 RepID=UPI000C1D6BCE|nr:zinc finger MYM-type protein 1-like [Olea europaea var. sylvestris]